MVHKLVNILMKMDGKDPFRIEMTDMLLEKLWVIYNKYDCVCVYRFIARYVFVMELDLDPEL